MDSTHTQGHAADNATGHTNGDHVIDHGGHADHQHLPHEQSKGASGGTWRTIGILVAAAVLFAVISSVWNSYSLLHRLETQVTQLREQSDKKAEKGDVAHLEGKLDEVAKNADAQFLDLSGKKADRADAVNLADKVASKADATLVQSQLAGHIGEINALRKTTSDQNASYNNTTGKYETFINKNEAEVATLKSHVTTLIGKVSKLETMSNSHCEAVKQLRDVRLEKLSTELTTIRERLASIEAALKK
jgi:archaellum component FlaC